MKKIIATLISSTLIATSLIAAPPQTLVFDFGGVMTGESNREIVVNFIRKTFNLSQDEFDKANKEKHIALKSGQTDEEFWISYAKKNGVQLTDNWGQSLRDVLKASIGINPEMYALVNFLKEQQIPIAMLSNIDDRLAKLIRGFGLYEPFDPCLLSCEIGVEKPNPKAFELLLSKLNLPANEVVFIDDRWDNVEAAKKLGIDAILFKSTEQLKTELSKRGIENIQ